MLFSPSEKSKEKSPNSSSVRGDNETEISIDFSKIALQTPSKGRKNITIQITNLDDLNATKESISNSALSPISREKLIKLKIKMPKSPRINGEPKRDKSFFTEKDFSTLPKEFIKFANSMICGDDPRKRYCDKSLNEERCSNNDSLEKEINALSPIMRNPKVEIPSSTPKKLDDELEEDPSDEKGEFELASPSRDEKEFNGVKICEMIEKRPQEVVLKPYEDIIAKLKPYSKYRMQYLHNLRRLQNKEYDKNTTMDLCLSNIDQSSLNQSSVYNDLDENHLISLVNQSAKYRPIMGKNALISKMTKQHELDDSEIVRELVTQKFSPFFHRRRKDKPRDDTNNYSLPIDSLYHDKDEKLAKMNNDLNQTIHRIVVNEEVYAVINKNNKIKELETKPPEEEDVSKITSQEGDQSKPTEFSAYSDYDVEKFLHNAIGEITDLSQTMDTSRVSKRLDRSAEDYSIATGEMSLLVSKASSISTFCSTIWRRITRRNSAVAPQDEEISEEDEERLRMEERNKMITLLKQEASVQYEIVRQASKALDYCDHLPGVDFLSQRIEAERVILVATHKSKMIQHEIEDVSYYSTIRPTCNYLGSFTVKNLRFEVKDVPLKSEDCSQWYVCILSKDTETMASRTVQADEDGGVFFKETFTFDYLPPDFEIAVSVFTLKVKKHKDSRSTFQRMKFFSFRRNTKQTLARKSLSSRFSRTSLRSPNKEYDLLAIPVRSSSFLLLGETTLTIKDVGKTNLILNNVANLANIAEEFTASIESFVNIEENYSDFLNVGTESGERVIWSRRWCTLENMNFLYWNSPNEGETDAPLKKLDLSYAIKDVKSADRSICPRARTLQLEVMSPLKSEDDERYTIERYFLTSDTSESMHSWGKALNSVISTLKAWNGLKPVGKIN